MDDLFDAGMRLGPAAPDAEPRRALDREPIHVFDIAVQGVRETPWQDLFQGFRCLKAITYWASVPAILDVAALFDDVEITFGSERVLSRELAALEHVTNATGYRFTDALADQKAFIERFVRPILSRRGARLLERVQEGSLRFRLLRETPSHAKLYLLAGCQRFRAIAGSANLSLAALSGFRSRHLGGASPVDRRSRNEQVRAPGQAIWAMSVDMMGRIYGEAISIHRFVH